MKMIRERWTALILSVGAALLSVLPYIIAWRITPGFSTFSGFLINPIDGFSYLAKMQQGLEGHWSFILPYASDPGPRALLYVYYLLLGHVSRLTSIEPIWVFHTARFFAAILLFYLAYLLHEQISSHRNVRWFGFGLFVLGSGMGWLGLFVPGLESSDVLIPESIPFLVAYSNAHFPLAAAALLGGILAALTEGWRIWKRMTIAGLCGFTLGALLPFSLVSLLTILGSWFLVEIAYSGLRKSNRGNIRASLKAAIAMAGASIGALPWVVYDYWLSQQHPVIAGWNAQNQTPSPAPWAYLIGFGPLLILGLIGIVQGRPWRTDKGRLLIIWLLTGAILLYAPLAFQRRLSLGLVFPLGILAAWGWGSIPMRVKRRKPLAVLLLALISLTNVLVVFAGVSGAARGDPAVVYLTGELESYRWIEGHAPKGSLVLSGERAGNRLPAFAEVRVLYGHPFETPEADRQRELVVSLFREEGMSLQDIQKLGISWVYYGPEEHTLGTPTWLSALKMQWRQGDFTIYEVPPA